MSAAHIPKHTASALTNEQLLDCQRSDEQRLDGHRMRHLEEQVTHLETALHTQRLIGTAIGLCAQRFGCTTDQAWRVLVRISQNTNIKVRVAARVLCEAFNGESSGEDDDLLRQLSAQLPASGWPGVTLLKRDEKGTEANGPECGGTQT